MDPVTHGLSGALLAAVARRRRSLGAIGDVLETRMDKGVSGIAMWKFVLVLAIAAMSPDIDILLEQISNIATLTDRRGITHSIIGIPIMALLVGSLFALLFRDLARIKGYLIASSVGVALHILFDLINAFGVMLLAPFSFHRFDFGITFIIDIWLTLLLLLGGIASLVWRRTRVPAIIAWGAIAIYFGMMIWGKHEAQSFAEKSFTAQFPQANLSAKNVRVEVYPRPLSPFNWTAVLQNGKDIRVAHFNVVASSVARVSEDAGFIARIRAEFQATKDARWIDRSTDATDANVQALVARAWAHADFQFFESFSELPAFMKAESLASSLGECVFFEDLRFVSPGRVAHPFRYGMCFQGSDDANAKVYRYADDGKHELVTHPRRLLF
jgi:inner membrane protein